MLTRAGPEAKIHSPMDVSLEILRGLKEIVQHNHRFLFFDTRIRFDIPVEKGFLDDLARRLVGWTMGQKRQYVPPPHPEKVLVSIVARHARGKQNCLMLMHCPG